MKTYINMMINVADLEMGNLVEVSRPVVSSIPTPLGS
jgi:hypothetical protein